MQDDFILKGGLTADELPEGRAIYDTNDRFNPTGKDLVNATSWLPGPAGAIAGGADVWNSARDANINPMTAGALALGAAGLGLFGGNLINKFLPKGKMAGYLRIGGKPGEIISDTGKTYNLGNNVNLQDIINDANAYEAPFRRGITKYDTPPMQSWLLDIDDFDFMPALEAVKANPSLASERFVEKMDDIAKEAYSKKPAKLNQDTIYKHYSKEPLADISRGYTGISGGDYAGVGPSGAVYMVGDTTNLENLPSNYYVNRISGPSKDSFIRGDLENVDLFGSNAYDIMNETSNRLNIPFELSTPVDYQYNKIVDVYPYINRLLRNEGYAGFTNKYPTAMSWYDNKPFREYVGFSPEDYTVLENIKLPDGILK